MYLVEVLKAPPSSLSVTVTDEDMIASVCRCLGSLAVDTGTDAEAARDELLTQNASKAVINILTKPDYARNAKVLYACLYAIRNFAGSDESDMAAASLLRKDIIVKGGDVAVAKALKANTHELEIQRMGMGALRNLSYGTRMDSEDLRNVMITNQCHTSAITALRTYNSIEHEPRRQVGVCGVWTLPAHARSHCRRLRFARVRAREPHPSTLALPKTTTTTTTTLTCCVKLACVQVLVTALHVASLGVIRNLAYGAGQAAELRRTAMIHEKADESILSALAGASGYLEESLAKGQSPQVDIIAMHSVGVVALGNLLSGLGYVAENRRHERVTNLSHVPIYRAMDNFHRDPQMQYVCMVALASFLLGHGTGADKVRSMIVEYELPDTRSRANDLISLVAQAMRRFPKDVKVQQAAIIVYANMCIGTSASGNEIRLMLLEEGA